MSWLEALILGLVQGLTEFLPVSSSGHLEIGSVLLGVSVKNNLLFAVVVHLATALSTLVVYRKDVGRIIQGIFELKENEAWRFAISILISMVPVFIVGVFFRDPVEELFAGNMVLVGSMLLITAVLLSFSHFYRSGRSDITPLKAFIVGIAQAIAVLPGISRSGATISTALILGVEREKAARFSFLMVIIPILGAAAIKLKDYMSMSPSSEISVMSLVVGFLAAFISGFFACKLMIRLVTRSTLLFFAVYCGVVGLIAIISQL